MNDSSVSPLEEVILCSKMLQDGLPTVGELRARVLRLLQAHPEVAAQLDEQQWAALGTPRAPKTHALALTFSDEKRSA